jgi:hypothetical protein
MKAFNQNTYACELNWTGDGSEDAYCPNGFKVNYKQISSVPLHPIFLTLKSLKWPVFSFKKSGHPTLSQCCHTELQCKLPVTFLHYKTGIVTITNCMKIRWISTPDVAHRQPLLPCCTQPFKKHKNVSIYSSAQQISNCDIPQSKFPFCSTALDNYQTMWHQN